MTGVLPYLRSEIDEIDIELVRLLNKRFDICEAIGWAKKAIGSQTIQDSTREQAILDNLSLKETHPDMVKTLWPVIMNYSKLLQSKLN